MATTIAEWTSTEQVVIHHNRYGVRILANGIETSIGLTGLFDVGPEDAHYNSWKIEASGTRELVKLFRLREWNRRHQANPYDTPRFSGLWTT